VETKQVYGVSLQQKRNDAKIDAKLFENIISKDKTVKSSFLLILTTQLASGERRR